MNACLMLLALLLIPPVCGGLGPEDAQRPASEDESLVLSRRHLETGIALHESGRFSEAVPEYDLALRLYPYHAEAYLNRGKAYAQLDETQRAIQDYEQAVRLDPNLPGAYAGWGRALVAMEQPEEAIRYFDEAVLLDQLDTASYLDRGDAYSELGRDDRTLSDYNEAVQIEPHMAEAISAGLTVPALLSSSWRWRGYSKPVMLSHRRAYPSGVSDLCLYPGKQEPRDLTPYIFTRPATGLEHGKSVVCAF